VSREDDRLAVTLMFVALFGGPILVWVGKATGY
jgi:hypothetical protein